MVKSRGGACVALTLALSMILPPAMVSADQGAQAAGGLFTGNCVPELADAAKIEKGLQQLNDKIDRAQNMVDDARKNAGQLSRDAAKQSAQAKKELLADNAVTVLANMSNVITELESMARVAPGGKRLAALKAVSEMKNLEKLYKQIKGIAGSGSGTATVLEAQGALQRLEAVARFIDDAGFTGEGASYVASKVATRAGVAGGAPLAGMMGGLVVVASIWAIDTIAADEGAHLDTLDMDRAADTVNQLRQTRGLLEDKIRNVREKCKAQPQKSQQARRAANDPPAPPVPAVVAAPEASGGGSGLGLVLILGGAGAVGYGAYKYLESTQSPDLGCVTADKALEIARACGSNPNSAACQQVFAVDDKCCRDAGKKGYSISAGACY